MENSLVTYVGIYQHFGDTGRPAGQQGAADEAGTLWVTSFRAFIFFHEHLLCISCKPGPGATIVHKIKPGQCLGIRIHTKQGLPVEGDTQ